MKTKAYALLFFLLGASVAGNAILIAATSKQEDPEIKQAPMLGPASSLTLVNDANELVLSSLDDRLSWGKNDYQKAYSVAFINVGRVLNPLLSSTQFQDERDQFQDEIKDGETEYQAQLESLAAEMDGVDPQSSEGQEIIAEGRAKHQELQDWLRLMMVKRNQLESGHLATAYQELISAVQIVADRKKIDIVLRTIPPEDEILSENVEATMLQIRLRSALVYPEDLEITEDVMNELGVDQN
jgi:Skp family chaperone for outer membrane proteins